MIRIDLTSSAILWVLGSVTIIFSLIWIVWHSRDDYYDKHIRILLIGLRTLAILIFLLIVMDLHITHLHDQQVKPKIAFLWDLSKSMNDQNREFRPGMILRTPAYRELARQTDIVHVVNMSEPRIVNESKLQTLSTDEEISDNARLLRFAEKQAVFDELVLVSDGRSYLGESLESLQLIPGLSIHTLGVGSDSISNLPELKSVDFPDPILEGDSIRVQWTLNNPSDKPLSTQLIVQRDGQELYRQTVELPARRMLAFDHTFAPAKEGVGEWDWRVPGEDRDIVIGTRIIRVRGSNILIVTANDPPDQDIAMIRFILSTSDKITLYDIDDWRRSFPDKKPDLLIQTWNPINRPRLFDRCPAILFYRDEQDAYAKTGDLLIETQTPYVLFETDPLKNARFWTQMPPVDVAEYKTNDPVIIRTRNGRPILFEDREQDALIVNASGLWRWNLAGFEKDWGGLYRYLVTGMVEDRLRRNGRSFIAFDESVYYQYIYQPVHAKVLIYDDRIGRTSGSRLQVSLLDSTFSEIRRQELKYPETSVSFTLKEKGDYYAVADLMINGKEMERDTSLIRIAEHDMENNLKGCDEKVLNNLAHRHGGTYRHLDTPGNLRFDVRTEKKWETITTVFIARRSYVLYVLMFLLLCADWVIRKRYGGM